MSVNGIYFLTEVFAGQLVFSRSRLPQSMILASIVPSDTNSSTSCSFVLPERLPGAMVPRRSLTSPDRSCLGSGGSSVWKTECRLMTRWAVSCRSSSRTNFKPRSWIGLLRLQTLTVMTHGSRGSSRSTEKLYVDRVVQNTVSRPCTWSARGPASLRGRWCIEC